MNKVRSISYWFRRSPLADLHRQSRTGVNCRHLPCHHCAGDWYLRAYQIPFAGSLALFYFTMVIYGLSLVGFGLLISSLCSTQQQAFIGVFVFMMPAILLSGYVSPVENMPVWLQNLTWINPIRHFTDITKQIYLKDASLDIVWNSLWPLLVITATTGSAAYAMFRRKVM